MVREPSNRANQSLDRYLQEIGEVPLLTPDEEKPQLVQELERSCPTLHFISWIDLIKLMTAEGSDGGKNPVG